MAIGKKGSYATVQAPQSDMAGITERGLARIGDIMAQQRVADAKAAEAARKKSLEQSKRIADSLTGFDPGKLSGRWLSQWDAKVAYSSEKVADLTLDLIKAEESGNIQEQVRLRNERNKIYNQAETYKNFHAALIGMSKQMNEADKTLNKDTIEQWNFILNGGNGENWDLIADTDEIRIRKSDGTDEIKPLDEFATEVSTVALIPNLDVDSKMKAITSVAGTREVTREVEGQIFRDRVAKDPTPFVNDYIGNLSTDELMSTNMNLSEGQLMAKKMILENEELENIDDVKRMLIHQSKLRANELSSIRNTPEFRKEQQRAKRVLDALQPIPMDIEDQEDPMMPGVGYMDDGSFSIARDAQGREVRGRGIMIKGKKINLPDEQGNVVPTTVKGLFQGEDGRFYARLFRADAISDAELNTLYSKAKDATTLRKKENIRNRIKDQGFIHVPDYELILTELGLESTDDLVTLIENAYSEKGIEANKEQIYLNF